MQQIRRQQGFSVVEAILIIVALGILGFTGWFVYHGQKTANQTLSNTNKAAQGSATKAASVTDFDSCVKAAGSTLQQTYPEKCVTKDGKSFTDTAAQGKN